MRDAENVVAQAEPNNRSSVVAWFRKHVTRQRVMVIGPILSLLVLCIVFAFASDNFVSLTNLQVILRQSALLWVVMCASTFVILLGSIDLSVEGSMVLVSAVIAVLMKNRFYSTDLGLWALPIGVVTATAVGLLNGLFYVKLRVPSFVSTLAMWFIAFGLATLILQGAVIPVQDPRLGVLYTGKLLGVSYPLIIAVVMVAIAHVLLRHTAFGSHVYAIGGGEDVAKMRGVRVDRVKIIAFVLAGLFLGVAGMLNTARMVQGTWNIGTWLFPSLTAVIVGGTSISGGEGGVLRGVVGVLFVVVLNNGMLLLGLSPYTQELMNGLILLVVVAATYNRGKMRLFK